MALEKREQRELDEAILDILSKSRTTAINIAGFDVGLSSQKIHVRLGEFFDALLRLERSGKVKLSILKTPSDPSAYYILVSLPR